MVASYSAAVLRRAEHRLGGGDPLAQVGDRGVELGPLRLHRPEPIEGEGMGAGELGRLLVVDVVEVEELADVLEREAEALALEDELEARPAAPGVQALLPGADRGEQLLGLVEAQGPRRDAEGGAHRADGLEIVAQGAVPSLCA